MLPSESLLQVLHFVDYGTVVLAKLAGKRFLLLVTKFAEDLARRHLFAVYFYTAYIEYDDVSIRTLTRSIRYEAGNPPSLAAACRELGEAIGSHSVLKLVFSENTWNMPGIGVVFEAAPPLKYAEQVGLFSPNGSTYNSNAFMSNFVGLKSLRLRFDYGIFRHFSWTFLRQECAHELRIIELIRPLIWSNDMNHSVEELVHCCSTLPHLLGGEALELDFSGSYFSAAFSLRVIELLKDSGREVTFRMTVDNSELLLDESEYTVDVDDTTTRYTSEKSGIVVEVEGREVTVRSTGDVSRKNPRRATNEEMSPTIPLVE